MEHPRFEDVCPIENGENLHLVMLGISGVHVSFREGIPYCNWALSNPKGFFGLTKISFRSPTLLKVGKRYKVARPLELFSAQSLWRCWSCVLFSFPGWKGDDEGWFRNPPNPKMAEKEAVFLDGGNSNIFYVHPKSGEMIQFDDHIFQMGWFNHQHIFVVFSNVLPSAVGIHFLRSESHMKALSSRLPRAGRWQVYEKLPETNSHFTPLYHAPAFWPLKKGSQKIVSEKHHFFPRVNYSCFKDCNLPWYITTLAPNNEFFGDSRFNLTKKMCQALPNMPNA